MDDDDFSISSDGYSEASLDDSFDAPKAVRSRCALSISPDIVVCALVMWCARRLFVFCEAVVWLVAECAGG